MTISVWWLRISTSCWQARVAEVVLYIYISTSRTQLMEARVAEVCVCMSVYEELSVVISMSCLSLTTCISIYIHNPYSTYIYRYIYMYTSRTLLEALVAGASVCVCVYTGPREAVCHSRRVLLCVYIIYIWHLYLYIYLLLPYSRWRHVSRKWVGVHWISKSCVSFTICVSIYIHNQYSAYIYIYM